MEVTLSEISRRDALKLGLLALSAVAWRPFQRWLTPGGTSGPWGRGAFWGRITVRHVPVFAEPRYDGPIQGYLTRDTLFPILEILESPYGPTFNPRWYRTWGGFIHTAYTQRVGFAPQWYGQPHLPESGQPAEVTVPYTQAYRLIQGVPQQPVYRLYYQSLHWVVDFIVSHGKRWFVIEDDLLRVRYAVVADHLRLLTPAEVTPLSPDVPPGEKHIWVSLREQRLVAYEGEEAVFQAQISSGIPSEQPTDNGIPTKTPSGRFFVTSKAFARHMGNGDLTTALEAYELPGVPWVAFFVETGVAFHGTYWHDNFGRPMSHGCINMRTEDARWLFRWTTPTLKAEADYWEDFKIGRGTTVVVTE